MNTFRGVWRKETSKDTLRNWVGAGWCCVDVSDAGGGKGYRDPESRALF